jgi:hypothetical protein
MLPTAKNKRNQRFIRDQRLLGCAEPSSVDCGGQLFDLSFVNYRGLWFAAARVCLAYTTSRG